MTLPRGFAEREKNDDYPRGTLPRGFSDYEIQRDCGGLPSIELGDTTRLDPKESIAVIFRNKYRKRYRMVLTIRADDYHALQWRTWVNPGQNKVKKVTNSFAASCALFTHADNGSWIDRLRYWLKV